MALKWDGHGTWAHSSVCYISTRTEDGYKFIPVKHAKPYKNDYGLDLFLITKEIVSEDGKRKLAAAGSITDGMSGCKVCNVEQFQAVMEKYGADRLKYQIHVLVDKFGWSPRYLNPDEKKSDVFPKEDKDEKDKCLLLTPVFVDGMFNRDGKRMRVKFVKTVSCDDASYDLYISASKTPDQDYAQDDDDKYYLHTLVNGWLIPLAETEKHMRQSAAFEQAVSQMYGDHHARDKFYNDLWKAGWKESQSAVNEQFQKERDLEDELAQDEKYMAQRVKKILDGHVQAYTACKNGTGNWPNFIGAVILNDQENCIKLSEIKQQNIEKERAIRRQKQEEEERRAAEEEARKEAEEQAAAEEILLHGGEIKDGHLICALADKYKVSIPLRTRGWILNTFAGCTVKGSEVSVRYWKSKNGSGSTKIYGIIFNIRNAIKEAQKMEA